MLLAWSIVRWGEDGPEVNVPVGQVFNMRWDPARLGTVGVRLPGPAGWYPGRLKPGLVLIEASKCLLSSDIVRHCLEPPRSKGVKVMEGGRSLVTSLWDPVGLWRPSKALELTGRVELSVWVSSMWTSFCLCPTDLADGEGEQPLLREPQALGDFSWPFEVGSLELEGFLAEVVTGHFGVCHWSVWCMVLGHSMDGLGAAALGEDCFITLGCLACW